MFYFVLLVFSDEKQVLAGCSAPLKCGAEIETEKKLPAKQSLTKQRSRTCR